MSNACLDQELDAMPKRFMDAMNDKLFTLILLEELHIAAKVMAIGKSPRLNGVIIE